MKLLIGIENSLKYFWAKTKHLNYYMIFKKTYFETNKTMLLLYIIFKSYLIYSVYIS